jgi:hypothetical protein
MRYIRLKSGSNDTTSQFTCNLSAPIILNKNASIALKSVNLNGLNQAYVRLDKNLVFVARPTSVISKTITILKGKYSKQEFIAEVTSKLNASFNSNDFTTQASLSGFEWRCNFDSRNRFVFNFDRIDSTPNSVFEKTTNITNPTAISYKRNSGTGNDAFILSEKPANRGCAVPILDITGAINTSSFLFGLTTVPTITNIPTFGIENYSYGVGTNPSDGYKLYTIFNGAFVTKIQNGSNPITPDQVQNVSFEHFAGLFIVKVQITPDNIISTNVSAINLYETYYTAITLQSSEPTFEFDTYYDSPYYNVVNNTLVETLIIPDNEVKTLGISASLVSVEMNNYSLGIFGFTENPTPLRRAKGSFTGSNSVSFVYLQDVVIELLSISQLEGYDTSTGYKRPLIYVFDNLDINDSSAFAEVPFPIFVSLKNDDNYMLSSITVRISAEGETFNIGDYASISLLIQD